MIRNTAFAVLSLVVAAVASAASPQRLDAQTAFTCESRNDQRTYCAVNARGNVHLVRQLSEADCVAGRTWGTDSRGVWVSRGCRAQFTVNNNPATRDGRRYDDDRYDDRRGDNRAERAALNQAQRVCRSAARNRYRDARSADVRTTYQGMDRSGHHIVRWNSQRESGTCRVNRSGELVNLRVSRR
jgi:hypothetical protein